MSDAGEAAEKSQVLEQVEIAQADRVPAGLKIDILQAGDKAKPAVFCLHGIGSNASGYAAQLAALSDRYHVIAWNAPGYGRSDNLPFEAPLADDFAHALAGMMDTMRIDKAVVVGSSFGGVIAAYFAALYPAKTLAAVLSAPAAGNARMTAGERKAILDKRINDMKTLGPDGVAAQRSTQLVAPDAPPHIVRAAHKLVAATNSPAYFQAAHVLDSADTITIAAGIAVPTLVLVGSEDKVTPAQTCARPIHAALRNGELRELAGVGHLIKLEAADIFNQTVSAFLERHNIR